MEKKVVYYKDELNDEFSDAEIIPDVIDKDYKYIHKGILWNVYAKLLFIITLPVKSIYPKIKFHIKYVGKEKIKPFKNQGCFIYVNHTQQFCDTFLPTNMIYPKPNAIICNPENVSMKGLRWLVKRFYPIPIPNRKDGINNFLNAIDYYIRQKKFAITIYPEAHIWPFCTWIRNFKDVSFKYPIKYNVPSFCMTNTYHVFGKKKNKVQIISYLDGPFYPDEKIENNKEKQRELRDRIYNQMCERVKTSDINVIEYIKKDD